MKKILCAALILALAIGPGMSAAAEADSAPIASQQPGAATQPVSGAAESEDPVKRLFEAFTDPDAAGDETADANSEAVDADDATAGERPFDAASAPFEGIWVPFEDGFRLYLPETWRAFELTEEQDRAGLFYRAGNDADGSASGETPMGVAVSYMEAGELATLEDLAEAFEAAGLESLEPRSLNGLEALGFENPAEDYRGVAFFHPLYPEYAIMIYVTPAKEADAAVGDAILASLTPTEPSAAFAVLN